MLPICLQALINRLKPKPLRLLPGSLRASALQELLGLQGLREPATQLLHGSLENAIRLGWISCNLHPCRKRNSQTCYPSTESNHKQSQGWKASAGAAGASGATGACKRELLRRWLWATARRTCWELQTSRKQDNNQQTQVCLSIQSARRLGYWGKCANKKRAKLTTQNLETC